MSGAEIADGIFELIKVVGVIFFTVAIIMPCVFYNHSDDERFLDKVAGVLNDCVNNTLRPLAVALLIVWLLVKIIARWQ